MGENETQQKKPRDTAALGHSGRITSPTGAGSATPVWCGT